MFYFKVLSSFTGETCSFLGPLPPPLLSFIFCSGTATGGASQQQLRVFRDSSFVSIQQITNADDNVPDSSPGNPSPYGRKSKQRISSISAAPRQGSEGIWGSKLRVLLNKLESLLIRGTLPLCLAILITYMTISLLDNSAIKLVSNQDVDRAKAIPFPWEMLATSEQRVHALYSSTQILLTHSTCLTSYRWRCPAEEDTKYTHHHLHKRETHCSLCIRKAQQATDT